jgi:osmotically-inducible protein OsmY
VVDDIEDTDNLLEVAGRVSGVEDVIDELDVRALQ